MALSRGVTEVGLLSLKPVFAFSCQFVCGPLEGVPREPMWVASTQTKVSRPAKV